MTKDQAEQLTVCAWGTLMLAFMGGLWTLHHLSTIARHLSTIAGAM